MKNTTRLTITAIVLILAINVSDVFTNISQPPLGRTGAPGELTCNDVGCHSGSNVQTNSSQILMSSISPADVFTQGYTPGVTYNMTLTLTMSAPRFGFETTCLDSSNNMAGDLTAVLSTTSATSTLVGREYLHHVNASSTNAWAFTWQAPQAGTDTVTFYVAANAANNNNSNTGDVIHTRSFNIFERPPGCDGIFISEYIEGTSFNKALELYNASASGIDINGYHLYIYNNGDTLPTDSFTFGSALVPAYGTYVIANGSSNASILAAADTTDAVISHNGDDAYLLTNASGDTLDIFGVLGQDPGVRWGGVAVNTINHTLLRKIDIRQGVEHYQSTFDPADEWVQYPQDFSDSLGGHINVCIPNLCSLFTVSATPTDASCSDVADGNVVLNITGGSGEYDITGSTSNLAAGNYNYTVTDTVTGCSQTVSFTIGAPPPLTADLYADSTSCGANNDGVIWVVKGGGTPPYVNDWNIPILSSIDTIFGLGAHQFSIIVTDAHGCLAYDTVEVFNRSFPAQPDITGDSLICLGSNATYNITPAPGETYTWALSGGGTLADMGDSASVAWNQLAGTYTLSVTPTNYCGAGTAQSLSVEVIAAPPIGLSFVGDSSVCVGDTVTYSMVTLTGSHTNFNWSVSSPGGSLVSDSANTVRIAWTANGQQTVVLELSNACGTSVDSLHVQVNGFPIDLGMDTTACDSFTIWPSNTFMNSYLWSDSSTNIWLPVTESGTYSLTAADFFGCEASDSVTIEISSAPVASFTESFPGDTLVYTNTSTSSTPFTSVWIFNDLTNNTTDTNSLASPIYPGWCIAYRNYTMTLIVTNACGSDTATRLDICEGVSEAPWADAVDVYPVPANNSVVVEWPAQPGDMQLRLLSLVGQTLQQQNLDGNSGQQLLDVSQLPAGIYLLQLQHETGVVQKKVLVE